MTAKTTTLSPSTVSDPTRRRRHRDSIAMTFRKDNTYEDPTLSLTDNVPEITNNHTSDDNDLLTMLRDVAQWDAGQEEVSPREMDMENTAGNTNNQSTTTAEVTETEATTTTPPEETTTIPELGHKMVRFDKALFHHHPPILGDNPACHEGIPLSIDWKAIETTTRDLRPETDTETNNPRSLTELYLTPHQRMHMSRHLLGYSLREIHQACKPVNIARKQRRRTLELLRFHKLHEFVEHLQRTLICQTQPMMMLGGSGHYTIVTGSSVQRKSKKTTTVPEDSLRRPRQTNKEALLLDNTQSTHASSTMDDSPTTALSVHQAANRRFSRPTVEEAEA